MNEKLLDTNLLSLAVDLLNSHDSPTNAHASTTEIQSGKISHEESENLLNTATMELQPCEDQQICTVYMCSSINCKQSFLTNKALVNHMMSHSTDKNKPYKCPLCDLHFETKYETTRHFKTHPKEKRYSCPYQGCLKKFKHTSDMQKHARTHTGERPYKCSVCLKNYSTKNILKVHMRIHTGERPFECTYPNCNKKFASQTNYRNHLRVHTGEKPYVCNIGSCQKRFAEYSSLQKHFSVHSSNSACYQCPLCNKVYKLQSSLLLHQRRDHKAAVEEREKNIILYSSKDSDLENMPANMHFIQEDLLNPSLLNTISIQLPPSSPSQHTTNADSQPSPLFTLNPDTTTSSLPVSAAPTCSFVTPCPLSSHDLPFPTSDSTSTLQLNATDSSSTSEIIITLPETLQINPSNVDLTDLEQLIDSPKIFCLSSI